MYRYNTEGAQETAVTVLDESRFTADHILTMYLLRCLRGAYRQPPDRIDRVDPYMFQGAVVPVRIMT